MDRNSEVGFEDVVRLEKNGQLLIGIDRTFARQFYTDLALRVVEAHTGEAPYLEKALVMGAFIGSPLAVLVSAILAILVIGWWSALAIPVALLVWIRWYSTSSHGRARLTGVSVLLVAVVVFWRLGSPVTRDVWTLVLIYVAALWLGRFVYIGSTFFLRAFVLRNQRAFDWLRGHLTLRKVC